MRNLIMLFFATITASLLLATGGCDSSEPTPEDAVLVNRTGEAVVYRFGAISTGPPEPLTDVDLGGGFQLLAVGDSAVVGTCSAGTLEDGDNLIIYEVLELSKDKKTATITTNEVISNTELEDRYKKGNCQIVVHSLS